jgi:hypothetical protein
MKKVILYLLLATGLIIVNTGTVSGQDVTVFRTESRITFDSESEEREVSVGVSDINTIMTLNIESFISSGHLTIEIYDPTGVKESNFNLGYSVKSKNEEIKVKKADNKTMASEESPVRGNINKSIKNPIQGDWIIKMIAKNATGIIRINVHHSTLQ